MKDKNKKIKLKVGIGGSIVAIFFSFFFSTKMYYFLEKIEITATDYLPLNIISNMQADRTYVLIFLSVFSILIMLVALMVLNIGERISFESEKDYITDDIKTPKAIGQGQHGTARWLNKKEYDITFASTVINSKDEIIRGLMNKGNKDKKKLRH